MSQGPFEIGRRYRNRQGYYEVLRFDGKRMVVRFDSGDERALDVEIAARIASNIEIEDQQQLPFGLDKTALSDFAWTLGAIAKEGFLSAEVPPQSDYGFRADYRSVAGAVDIDRLEGYFPITEGGYNKWGAELRIEFPDGLLLDPRFVVPKGVNVVSGHAPGVARINNNGFWWHLVSRLGFRLGKSQDVEGIKGRLPLDLQESFRSGAV